MAYRKSWMLKRLQRAWLMVDESSVPPPRRRRRSMHDGTFPTQNSALRANRTPFNNRSVGCGWHPGSADASAATSQSFATCSVVETVGVRRCGDLDRLVDMLLKRSAASRAPRAPLPPSKSAPEREILPSSLSLHILPLRPRPSLLLQHIAVVHRGGGASWITVRDTRCTRARAKARAVNGRQSAAMDPHVLHLIGHRALKLHESVLRRAAAKPSSLLHHE